MWNTRLDEVQSEIKIARRNINNLWYADDITLTSEEEEELKSLLMKVKEESKKASLKLNMQKWSWHWSHHFMAYRWVNSGNNGRFFIFLGSKITADGDCGHEIKTLAP